MPRRVIVGHDGGDAAQLSRRAALGHLIAAAGVATFGADPSRAQTASAPIGDASRLADLGMKLDPAQRAAGAAFLGRHASVDTHSHPGRFFLKNLPYETPTTRAFGEAFEDRAVADLYAGRVSGVLIAAVADMRLLEMTATAGLHAASNLATPAFSHPRLISSEHAKLVAAAGGIVGSWPSGIGQSKFADYIDSIRRLVDAVGIDHTAIGTDMDANYRPVLRSYLDWSLIPAALLARGMHDAEVAKIMGGNFLRVFTANLTR
jgi:hypothetical protein